LSADLKTSSLLCVHMMLVYMHIVLKSFNFDLQFYSKLDSDSYFLMYFSLQFCYFLLTFYLLVAAGVHDSFWVHACDVDQMNLILREQFVLTLQHANS
jgi:hypothetical protein